MTWYLQRQFEAGHMQVRRQHAITMSRRPERNYATMA